MAYRQSIGESFARPFREVETGARAGSLADEEQQRANMMPQMMRLKQQLAQAHLKLLQQRTSRMGQSNDMQEQMMDLKREQFAEQIREFNERQKQGGTSGGRNGIFGQTYNTTLPTGKNATFQHPTRNQVTADQQTMTAYRQISPLMQQMQAGAKYYMNKPEQLKKYLAAFSAGMVSPNLLSKDQQDILTKAGITQSAMIQAAETAARIMNMAKTNESLKVQMDLFRPQQGETPQSYLARQQSLHDDLKKRAVQASFESSVGQPVANLDDPDAEQNASDFEDDYINKKMGSSDAAVGSSSQQNDSDYLSDDNLNKVMKSKGLTHAQATDFLKALHKKGMI